MPVTTSGIASLPAMPLRVSTPNCGRPRSLRNTGVPRTEVTTMLPRSSGERIRPMPRMTATCSPRTSKLPPALALFALMVPMTCWSDRLYCASLEGSRASWNSVVSPPKVLTSASPGTCLSAGMTSHCCIAVSSRTLRVLDSSV